MASGPFKTKAAIIQVQIRIVGAHTGAPLQTVNFSYYERNRFPVPSSLGALLVAKLLLDLSCLYPSFLAQSPYMCYN